VVAIVAQVAIKVGRLPKAVLHYLLYATLADFITKTV
jgi:hypothetical protein